MTSKTIKNLKSNKPVKIQRFLLSHQFKKIGLVIAIVTYVALFINAFTVNNLELRFVIKCGMIVGMLTIAISKERFEDELISDLRMQSFTLAFIIGVLFSVLHPLLNYTMDYITNSEAAVFKVNGDFLILWVLLSVKVLYFESLKWFYK